jgi:glycosyltransferase involved in cell wall biosynthesis
MSIAVAPYPAQEQFYFSPLKVLEYMASGRAVVCSRIGQLETLIRDGETGILVEPGDPAALAGALHRLGSQADLRASLGRQAAAEAARLHSWNRRASGILGQVEAMA